MAKTSADFAVLDIMVMPKMATMAIIAVRATLTVTVLMTFYLMATISWEWEWL